MSDIDWGDYGELVDNESKAYYAMLDQRNPSVGRVYPSKVRAAEDAWAAAVVARQARNKELAAVLQVPAHRVAVAYFMDRLKKKKEDA